MQAIACFAFPSLDSLKGKAHAAPGRAGDSFVSNIIPFLNGQSFGPELTKIMGDAYDLARKELHDRGQPLIVQEIIASRIIALARTGARDPVQICNEALLALGLSR